MKSDSNPLIVLLGERSTNAVTLHSQIFQPLCEGMHSHYFQCFCPPTHHESSLLRNNTSCLDFTAFLSVNPTYKVMMLLKSDKPTQRKSRQQCCFNAVLGP